MSIQYAIVPCRLGQLLVAATERGVCKISLGDTEADLRADLEGEFPQAQRQRSGAALEAHVAAILAYLDGTRTRLDLPLDIQATVFQRRVWEALRQIPYGATRSYSQIAESIGQPGAARAVGGANHANPIAILVPCHRVVQAGGALGGYGGGIEVKRWLLAHEASHVPLLRPT
jgi:O-6-methylguanine DNA methyltransferase